MALGIDLDEIEKSDIPGATLVGSILAMVGDVMIYGGDVIISSILLLGTFAQEWRTLLVLLQPIARETDLLPEEPITMLVLAVFAILAITWIVRRLQRITSTS